MVRETVAFDRKAAAREYRENPRPVGVYRIRSAEGGVAFIGSSVDVPSMLNRARFELEMGSHRDRTLQAEWNRCGSEGFVFEVLDTLELPDDPAYDPGEDLAELLDMWRERLAAAET